MGYDHSRDSGMNEVDVGLKRCGQRVGKRPDDLCPALLVYIYVVLRTKELVCLVNRDLEADPISRSGATGCGETVLLQPCVDSLSCFRLGSNELCDL